MIVQDQVLIDVNDVEVLLYDLVCQTISTSTKILNKYLISDNHLGIENSGGQDNRFGIEGVSDT